MSSTTGTGGTTASGAAPTGTSGTRASGIARSSWRGPFRAVETRSVPVAIHRVPGAALEAPSARHASGPREEAASTTIATTKWPEPARTQGSLSHISFSASLQTDGACRDFATRAERCFPARARRPAAREPARRMTLRFSICSRTKQTPEGRSTGGCRSTHVTVVRAGRTRLIDQPSDHTPLHVEDVDPHLESGLRRRAVDPRGARHRIRAQNHCDRGHDDLRQPAHRQDRAGSRTRSRIARGAAHAREVTAEVGASAADGDGGGPCRPAVDRGRWRLRLRVSRAANPLRGSSARVRELTAREEACPLHASAWTVPSTSGDRGTTSHARDVDGAQLRPRRAAEVGIGAADVEPAARRARAPARRRPGAETERPRRIPRSTHREVRLEPSSRRTRIPARVHAPACRRGERLSRRRTRRPFGFPDHRGAGGEIECREHAAGRAADHPELAPDVDQAPVHREGVHQPIGLRAPRRSRARCRRRSRRIVACRGCPPATPKSPPT